MEGERSKRARSSSPNPCHSMSHSGGVPAIATPPPPPSSGLENVQGLLPLAFPVSANGDDVPMYMTENPSFVYTEEATVQGYLFTETYVRYSSYLVESQPRVDLQFDEESARLREVEERMRQSENAMAHAEQMILGV